MGRIREVLGLSLSVFQRFQAQVWAGILFSASLLLVSCGINLPRALKHHSPGWEGTRHVLIQGGEGS
jgi:hypothetical protein